MTRRRASVVGRGRAWRSVVADAVAVHRRIYGDTCPGWERPSHWSADLTGDHVIPIASGGLSTRANVAVLCRSCNSRKGSRPAPAIQLSLAIGEGDLGSLSRRDEPETRVCADMSHR